MQDHIAFRLKEERIAHIHGWDFSHIDGRYEEEGDLPQLEKLQKQVDEGKSVDGEIHRFFLVAKKQKNPPGLTSRGHFFAEISQP